MSNQNEKVQRIKMEKSIPLHKKFIYRLDYKEKLKSICSKRPSKTEVTNEENN